MSSAKSADIGITAMGGQGDGLGEQRLFVPFSLPGERVRVTIDRDRARLTDVLEASPDRIDPVCQHFGSCGGCSLQHWAPTPYLEWKRQQIIALLAHERLETEVLDTLATPSGSRRRVALHARHRQGGGVNLGFKERSAWDLVDIQSCSIADPALVAALDALRQVARPFLEHPKSAPTLHVTLTGTGLDVDVTGVERKSGGLSADARVRAARMAAEADLARLSLAGDVLYQSRQPMVRLGRADVALPPGAFLQASPAAENAMAQFALEEMSGAGKVADLFCGVGTFTFRLAEQARVRAAESSPQAIAALRRAIATAPGLKSIEAEVRDLSRQPILVSELKKLDAVLLDPPRSGAPEQCRELARSSIEKVVYVSCNPATFTRDAAALVAGGLKLEKILPVDQFLWSAHIELVAIFSR